MVARRLRFDAVLLLLFSGLLALVTADTVNRTIDDSLGDSQTGQTVVYSPSTGGTWKDENCIGCAINPDTSQTFEGTYTAATYNPGLRSMGITMQFTGTAIYVFFVLANNQGDGITTLTEANFTVDGGSPQLFQYIPDLTTTTILYNQLVYSQTNLANTDHTLVVSTSGVSTDVYVCFDYAIYTHVDVVTPPVSSSSSSTTSSSSSTSSTSTSTSSSTSTSPATRPIGTTTTGTSSSTTTAATTTTTSSGSSSPGATDSVGAAMTTDPASSKESHVSTGAIAGGAIGGVAVAALIILLLVLFCRRRNQRLAKRDIPSPMAELDQAAVVSPFIHSMTQSGYAGTSRSGLVSAYDRLPPGSLTESSFAPGHTTMPSAYSALSAVRSDDSSAYGGIAGPSPSASSALPDTMYGPLGPLRLVNSSDHLLEGDASFTLAHPSGDLESTRRERQIELDKRLQTIQQEMMDLASDVSNGEKGARHRSVRRLRASSKRDGGGDEGQEEEMSMSDMREQMRRMREQIAFLQDQQRSAWAQGLSNDPPPGYTPEIPS